MGDWNKEIPDYKSAKNGQTEQRPVSGANGKKRAKKEWKVVSTHDIFGRVNESVEYRGLDEESCEKWLAKQKNKCWTGFRNPTPEMIDAAKQRSAIRYARYNIVPPTEK